MALDAAEIKEVRRIVRREIAALTGVNINATTGRIPTPANQHHTARVQPTGSQVTDINDRIAALDAVFGGDAFV